MTRDRRFKQAVRRLMRATGQNYLSARSSLQPHESAVGGKEADMASSTQAARGDLRREVILRGERDLVMAYLEEINTYPVLTDAEEMQFAREKAVGELADWYRGDRDALSDAEVNMRTEAAQKGRLARKRLTEANLRLVVSIARRYQGQGLRLLDLIDAGNRGLMRAVDKFDGTQQRAQLTRDSAPQDYALEESTTFSTFAAPWITAAIHRALDVAQHARVPGYDEVRNNATARELQAFLEDQPAKLGREPTVEEVARELGFTPERARSYASRMAAMLDLEPSEADAERAARVLRAGKEQPDAS